MLPADSFFSASLVLGSCTVLERSICLAVVIDGWLLLRTAVAFVPRTQGDCRAHRQLGTAGAVGCTAAAAGGCRGYLSMDDWTNTCSGSNDWIPCRCE